MTRDWIPEQVAVGALVAVDNGRPYGVQLYTISRVTPTQVKLNSGLTLDRATGRIRGAGAWDTRLAFMPDTATLDDVRRRQLAEQLRTTKWSDYTLDELRAVVAALPVLETRKESP